MLALAAGLGAGSGASSPAEETPLPTESRAESTSSASAEESAASPKRVLILQTYGSAFEPYAQVAASFRTGLATTWNGPIEYFEVPFELARFDSGAEDDHFAGYLEVLLAERPADLVVTIAAPAAKFALRSREHLFPRTPLLLCGIDQRHLAGIRLDPLTAAVPVALDISQIVEDLLALLPATRTLAVVLGSSPLEKFWRTELERELARFQGRIEILWLDELPLQDLLQRASRLPPRSAILFSLLAVDAAGVPHESQKALSRLVEVANAPVFGTFDTQLGAGIVGGPLLSAEEVSRRAVGIADRILRGELPGLMRPPSVPLGPPTFDARQLARWKIPESRLPPGSKVRFSQPPAWKAAFWPLLGSLVVVTLETLLIVGLLVQRRRHLVAKAEVKALNRRLITAGEEERRRLARELHDDLSQRLARLAIDASLLERGSPAAATAAGAIREELSRIGTDLHDISHRLHPSMLESLGLAEALRAESERFARMERIDVELKLEELEIAVPRESALALFRVAQEAMRNVARHARASRFALQLRAVDDGVELVVDDDGVGFDPQQLPHGAGLGLTSMRERIEGVGGRLQIRSRPGGGTTIAAWAPGPELAA